MTTLGASVSTTARLTNHTSRSRAVSIAPFRAYQRPRALQTIRAGAVDLTGLSLDLHTAGPDLIASVAVIPAAALTAGAAIAGAYHLTICIYY